MRFATIMLVETNVSPSTYKQTTRNFTCFSTRTIVLADASAVILNLMLNFRHSCCYVCWGQSLYFRREWPRVLVRSAPQRADECYTTA